MSDSWAVGVAIYAAIVATGVLSLEVRRWVEAQARLVISVSPGMKTFNIPETEGKTYVVVTVVNRGASPTTLTHLALLGFSTKWQRLRRKHCRAAVVYPKIPGTTSGQLPHILEPGGEWKGMILENDTLREWADEGHLYAAIYASHSDRPTLEAVKLKPKREESLEGAEEW